MSNKWETTKIPKFLMDEIDKLVKSGLYTSRSDFLKEAVRLRLEEVNKESE